MKYFRDNWKEIVSIIVSWTLGIILIINFRELIFCKKLEGVSVFQFTIIVFSILLLLFPFISKFKIGKYIEIQKDLKDFKDELRSNFNFLSNSINSISNKVIVNNYDSDRLAKDLSDLKDKIDKEPNKEKVKETEIVNDTKSEDKLYSLIKARIEIESWLRKIVNEKYKIDDADKLSLNALSQKLFENDTESKSISNSLKTFIEIANAAVHGRSLGYEQIEQGYNLGVNLIRYLKIKTII